MVRLRGELAASLSLMEAPQGEAPKREAEEPVAARLVDLIQDRERPGGGWAREESPDRSQQWIDLNDEEEILVHEALGQPGLVHWEWSERRSQEIREWGTGSPEEVRARIVELIDERTDPARFGTDNTTAEVFPTAAGLVARVGAVRAEAERWHRSTSNTYAQVLEFTERARMQVWDEADEMGPIEGYTWQVEEWDAGRWRLVEEMDSPEVPSVVTARIVAFRDRYDVARPVLAVRVAELESRVSSSEAVQSQTRSALVSVARRLEAVGQQPTAVKRAPEASTGPESGAVVRPEVRGSSVE